MTVWTPRTPDVETWERRTQQDETWAGRTKDVEPWLPPGFGARLVVDGDGNYVVDANGSFVTANG